MATVTVCPLTSQLHPTWRSRLQVKCGGRTADIAVDQIRTIHRRLRR
ncbi:MAG: type II toxin-antitoxin system PemK/MazF family toxin [Lentisphaerae bacterium]|nr:type II toxin-antitoxin system PemK/MazF family toxin [Lentisphaerota bacterium]